MAAGDKVEVDEVYIDLAVSVDHILLNCTNVDYEQDMAKLLIHHFTTELRIKGCPTCGSQHPQSSRVHRNCPDA